MKQQQAPFTPTYKVTFVRQHDRVQLGEWETDFLPLVPQVGALVRLLDLDSRDRLLLWEVGLLCYDTPVDVRVEVEQPGYWRARQKRDK